MKRWIYLTIIMVMAGCGRVEEGLPKDKRSYESIKLPLKECKLKRDEFYIVSNLTHENVTLELTNCLDSIIGPTWKDEKIYQQLSDSIKKCLYPLTQISKNKETHFYDVDTSGIVWKNQSELTMDPDKFLKLENFFTHIESNDKKIQLKLYPCYYEYMAPTRPLSIMRRKHGEQRWKKENKLGYKVQLNLLINLRIDRGDSHFFNRNLEYYQLTLQDTCEIFKNKF